jgi:hypothetical protein
VKISAFDDLYKGRRESAVQTVPRIARAIRQRKRYHSLEFSLIAPDQVVSQLWALQAERIARWFTQGKECAAQQAGKTRARWGLVSQ